MKLTKNQVIEVANIYINEELIPITRSANAIQQIMYGTVLGLASKRIPALIDMYADDKSLKALGIVDDSGYLDVDLLISTIKENWRDGEKITMGGINFSKNDLDKIYSICSRYTK